MAAPAHLLGSSMWAKGEIPHCSLDYKPGEETYIISLGGGGHKSAADAIHYKLLQESNNQEGVVHKVDALRNTILPNFLSAQVMNSWDRAKRDGDIEKQTNLVRGKLLGLIKYSTISDFLFFLPIFLKTFFTLLGNRKITRIVDAQPVGTNAILTAVRMINFIFNRHIHIYKMMTDMPTEEAIHFSESAKKLTDADKEIYHLLSTYPFPKLKDEVEIDYNNRMDAWWKEHFNLSLKRGEVAYADFPLRPGFIRTKNEPSEDSSKNLGIKINNADEVRLLVEADIIEEASLKQKKNMLLPSEGEALIDTTYDFAPIQVDNHDMVGLITIGSQANAPATKAYIDDVIELVEQFNTMVDEAEGETKNFRLFVACGNHQPIQKSLFGPTKPSLFSEVAEMIKDKKNLRKFPENLIIVPMGFQTDEEMAPLMHRADFGIYGAGGLTTMEAIAVSDPKRANVLIHSDAQGATVDMQDNEIQKILLKGFALWEKGNAEYQLSNETYKAKLVAPHGIFGMRLKEIFDRQINLGLQEVAI